MFRKLIPLAILPVLLAAQPAEARRLFWWEATNGDNFDEVYGVDPFAAPEDVYNQREYELYRREMSRRYRQTYYDDPYADDPAFDYPYVEPRQPKKAKKKKVVQRPVAVKPLETSTITKPPKPVVKYVPAQKVAVAKPVEAVKPPKLAGVTCEKGLGIVSSFGFSNVATKSCAGGTFTYSAQRGGKPFEVQVSAASGELTAVKKL